MTGVSKTELQIMRLGDFAKICAMRSMICGMMKPKMMARCHPGRCEHRGSEDCRRNWYRTTLNAVCHGMNWRKLRCDHVLCIDTLPGDSTLLAPCLLPSENGGPSLVKEEERNEGWWCGCFFWKKYPMRIEIGWPRHWMCSIPNGFIDMGYNTYLIPIVKYRWMRRIPIWKICGWEVLSVNLFPFTCKCCGYMNFNYGLVWNGIISRYDHDFTIIRTWIHHGWDEPTFNYDKKFNSIPHTFLLGFETKPWDTDNSFAWWFGCRTDAAEKQNIK